MAIPVSELLDTGVVSGGGLVEPRVIDLGPRHQRQRRVNYAAKRLVDMIFVTGLDQAEAERRFRATETLAPGGLQTLGTAEGVPPPPVVVADPAARRVTVTWDDKAFGPPVVGHAVAAPGYGGIVLGTATRPGFEPAPIGRAGFEAGRAWPKGDAGAVETPAALADAAARFLAASPGVYGVMVATPDRVLLERYGAGGGPAVVTPSWSVTKAITATLIGRLVHEGWLESIHDPAPAPLWRDPRGIHRLITIDHLMRMRSGLGFPMVDGAGGTRGGFENGEVYCEGEDAFVAAQRACVLTVPGAVYRYINTGINVLGAIIRDRIEARGLPYHETVYGLLADRIGMSSYQHSADIAGNFVASGSGFATLRDYTRFGLFLLQDGVWDGERLLPEGWVDQAMRPSHTGSAYAASMRSNADAQFPSLPRDAAWATGASGQRVFVLKRAGVVMTVTNETDHLQDLAALDALGVAAMAAASSGA
ncbi:MAG: serine hydrolase domain-containing protein [Janthinobacterium lividum]